ncbi:MAG: hypothetical protein GX323_09750 [Clostridiales bacterium]|nr:hypothetical protein [Clostridiales bacterium]
MGKIKKLEQVKYKVFLVLIIFQVTISLLSFLAIKSEIHSQKEKFGTVMTAPSLADIINYLRLFNIFYIIIGLLTILPGIFLYQYFLGSKSIYTMLRLPGKYSRLKFYIGQVRFSIKGILELWFIQLLLLFVVYLLYILIIQRESIIENHWYRFWEANYISMIYPFTRLWDFIPLVFMEVLLANISILLVLIERSRKRSILAVIGIILSVAGIYSYSTGLLHSLWIVPVTGILSVAISVFYIYKVEIV